MLEARLNNTTIQIPPECAPRVLRILRISAVGEAMVGVLEAQQLLRETLEHLVGERAADEAMTALDAGIGETWDAIDAKISGGK